MVATVNASSSSATSRAELDAPLPDLVAAWCRGERRELLEPLVFRGPGDAPELPAPLLDRGRIAAALGRANEGYGHPAARSLAERLAAPETRVVISGQQPGLFGGPLYTLLKALGTTLEAERLERAGVPAVPLFWVATEDHDFLEVSRAGFWDGQSRIEVSLGEDASPLLPVGMRTLGPGVVAALATLAERFGYSPFAEWLDVLRTRYRPDARIGEAFCRTLVDLLAARTPLLVDAMLPELKQAEVPHLTRLVEARHEVREALAERARRLEAAGVPLQVAHQDEPAPLFLLTGEERRRVVWAGADAYELRGGAAPAEIGRLLETVAENPAVVSPNVLSRPVVQDAVLGTALHLLGPGELSYFAQLGPLYGILGVTQPVVTLRPQALLVEDRHRRILDELELPLSSLLEPEDALDERLARRLAPDFVEPARQRLADVLDEVRDQALALDPNLERPFEKTRDHVDRSLDTFAQKVRQAAARRDEVARRRLDNLRAFAAPGGVPHERTLAASYFRGRYGEALADRMAATLASRPGCLQIVDPSEDTA
jgi:bacillithiol biosynthesis cysteine-adding enzyme BshC